MMIGKLNDWDSTLFIETGFFKTHLTLEGKGKKVKIELDKYKLKELIKLLEKCK